MAKTVDGVRFAELSARLKTIEIECAKLDERKAVSTEKRKAARAKLKELGFPPAEAQQMIDKLGAKIEKDVSDLEELLGLG